jgi:hypothetical protein
MLAVPFGRVGMATVYLIFKEAPMVLVFHFDGVAALGWDLVK